MKQSAFMIALSLLAWHACSSTHQSRFEDQPDPYKVILGRWRNEKDRNDVIYVDKSQYYEIYGKDTDNVKSYLFSASCKVKDSARKNKSSDLFLILREKGQDNECNKILGLDKRTFSWVSDQSGRITVFSRIK